MCISIQEVLIQGCYTDTGLNIRITNNYTLYIHTDTYFLLYDSDFLITVHTRN